MNKFIQAVTTLNVGQTRQLLESEEKWRTWSQPDGKNALHFLCGTPIVAKWNVPAYELKPPDPERAEASLAILKLLLKHGLDINSIHRIPDKNCGYFPGTPVWYAYTRGRNEKLYTWLLKNDGSPDHCLFAITWYDDVKAANLFRKCGALRSILDAPLLRDGLASKVKNSDYLDSAFRDPQSAIKKLSECLLASISWKKFRMADWLLKNGADPNVTDPRGNTPLLYMVKKKYPREAITLLLKHGANPDRENPKGESARKIAARSRDKTISDLFTN
jgi:Ankyrin repeats (many copies)